MNDYTNSIKKDLKFLVLIFIILILVHTLLWVGWPLNAGPDADSYIYYYLDSFNTQPVFYNLICNRPPVAPIFFGLSLTLGGEILTDILLEVLCLVSFLLIYFIVLSWGKWAARITVLIMMFLLPFQLQFHQIGTDGLFSFLLILYFFILTLAFKKLTYLRIIGLGIVAALATLTRTAGIVLLATPIIFFLKPLRINFKKATFFLIIMLLSSSLLIGGYMGYKGLRYGDYSISRGFKHTTFYRVYRVQEGSLIKRNNGPYTEKFISLIEKYILTSENYRKYGISIDDFLNFKPNGRFTSDSLAIVDLKEGWNTHYELLSQVAWEAIEAEPFEFIKQFGKDFISLMVKNHNIDLMPEKVLPIDSGDIITEGELIPKPNYWWPATRPDGTFPSEEEMDRFENNASRITELYKNNTGNLLVQKTIIFIWNNTRIPIIYFYLFGLLGIVIGTRKDRLFLSTAYILLLIYILGTLQSSFPWLRYRLPLDPMFISAGIIGISIIIKRLSINKT